MSEPTAWENRETASQILADTAVMLGIETSTRNDDTRPLTCLLPDGGEGWAYSLRSWQGPPVADIDTAVARVRAMWEGLGFSVDTRDVGPARGLVGTAPTGEVLQFLTGPGGTGTTGETRCCEVDGQEPTVH